VKPKPPKAAKPQSVASLAQELGVQRNTLASWAKNENLDLSDRAAVLARMKQKRGGEPDEDLASARLRKLTLEADRIQLALDIERGVYVPAETQRAAGEQLGNLIKQTFLRMSADLTPILTGRPSPEVKKELDRYARAKLTELSQYQGHIKIEAE
jgi:hypothetical protein